jgi:hypothetical protein
MASRAAEGSPAVTFVGVVLVVLAVGFAVLAVVLNRFERRQREGALTTAGTVVIVFPRGPLVRFTTARGDHIDFTADARWRRFKAGDQVRVYYHPDNPAFAGIDDVVTRWRGVMAAGSASALLLVLGIGFATYRPRLD